MTTLSNGCLLLTHLPEPSLFHKWCWKLLNSDIHQKLEIFISRGSRSLHNSLDSLFQRSYSVPPELSHVGPSCQGKPPVALGERHHAVYSSSTNSRNPVAV